MQKRLEDGTMVKLNVDIPPQIYYSQVLCHKSRWMSPFMAGLIDMIKEARPAGTQEIQQPIQCGSFTGCRV